MHIFVTGGCGFIGSHIVEHHLAKGDTVHVVDDLTSGTLQNLAPFQNNSDLKIDKANILDWSGLEDAVSHADRVYHFAGVVGIYRVLAEPVNVMATNVVGTDRLLNAISKTGKKPRVIIASSSSVYGPSEKSLLSEKDSLIVQPHGHPLWGYAVSKIADEAIGLAYFKMSGIPITMIRLFNTIGPRQTGRYGMVVPRFVKQACEGEPITIYGNGTQTRSFCDVRDALAAIQLLMETEKSAGQVYNVGNNFEISINHLAEIVKASTRSNSEIKYISYIEAYGEDFADTKQRRPDLSKLVGLTEFKHSWSIEKTVDDLVIRYRAENEKHPERLKYPLPPQVLL